MTNAPPHGSPGAPHLSYSNPTSGIVPRRSSYASVAAGNPSQAPQLPQIQSSSSHLPRIVNTSSYSHNQSSDQPSRLSQSMADPDYQGGGTTNIPSSWGREGETSGYLGPQRQNLSYGFGIGSGDSPSFIRPSYLHGSVYMETLEESHRERLAAQRDEHPMRPPNHGSLSTSSSSVSLQKMAPSHRGMTYEIIEHQPHPEMVDPAPLPSRWLETDKYGGLEVSADGLEVKYVSLHKLGELEAAATRSDHPMPAQCGIYYYEVNIISKGKEGLIGVGFSAAHASLEKLPGWEPESWAYHGDDGKSYCGPSHGKNYGPTFTSGDIIGCGVNFMTGICFFTKNGVWLGDAFKDLKDIRVYPTIGMKRPNAHLTVNFGQERFAYDIDAMVLRQKQAIREEIDSVNLSAMHPTLGKDDLCRALVSQYLSHDGYVETAKAFATEVQDNATALKGEPDLKLEGYLSVEEDHDALHRQEIRTAILDGHIDRTLNLTQTYYPQVLHDNPQIYFKLRCRKFVEMLRQSTDLLEIPTDKQTKSLNGHSLTRSEDGYEREMDVDDVPREVDDSDKMDTEEPDQYTSDNNVRYNLLLTQLIQYGQELKSEFKDDQSQLVTDMFTDIFSMLAYRDPRKSPHGKMLDTQQRVPVVEALNSAILVSLGKSSSTALERLYKETSILVDLVGEEGGPGAFVNVGNILRSCRYLQ